MPSDQQEPVKRPKARTVIIHPDDAGANWSSYDVDEVDAYTDQCDRDIKALEYRLDVLASNPNNEARSLTAGQIRHRVTKFKSTGDWKTGSVESVFSIQRAGLMLRIRCRDKDVLQQVKEALKTLRREMKNELSREEA